MPDSVRPENESKPYEASASKAEDNKSSAFVLLSVGVLGIIVVILGIAEVLPIQLNGNSKYMVYGMMGALFALFIVMGIVSMRSYRVFAKKAESENDIRNALEKWCLENLEAGAIDAAIPEDEAVSDEAKYFKRTQYMKEKIGDKFMNLDEAFLDHFVDEIYEDIFE